MGTAATSLTQSDQEVLHTETEGPKARKNGLEKSARRIANNYWKSNSAKEIRQLRAQGTEGTTTMLRDELVALLQNLPPGCGEGEEERKQKRRGIGPPFFGGEFIGACCERTAGLREHR